MIKKTVRYQDWDDQTQVEDLYFHLSKSDVLGELTLIDRMERFKEEVVEGPQRDLSTAEKQEMVDLIRTFMRLSYGRRVDSKQFRKSPEIWAEFESTQAFEAYFWLLFTDPNEFTSFMTGILPPDLMAQAKQQLGDADLVKLGESVGTTQPVEDITAPPIPQPEKPVEEMSAEELKERLRKLEG